jgi:HAD superfamily hydrolase (TIGR01549 family)
MSYIRNLVVKYRNAIHAIVNGAPYRSPFNIIKTAMENSLIAQKIEAEPDLIAEAAQKFKDLHIELSRPNEQVNDLLDSLSSKGKKLGIITNSFEGHASILLKRLNWGHYFSSVLDSSSVKNYKPSRLLFERAARDLGLEPSKMVYVGDEFYSDMVGGKSVGMTTIWINRRQRSQSDLVAKHGISSKPDLVLNSVSEMCELL